MSLDVALVVGGSAVFERSITHNLTEMADVVKLYWPLWMPEYLGVTYAEQLVPHLEAGLQRLLANEEECQKHNPDNNWGSYGQLVRFVTDYLAACKQNPQAIVAASR